jgi:hypothetical protein
MTSTAHAETVRGSTTFRRRSIKAAEAIETEERHYERFAAPAWL